MAQKMSDLRATWGHSKLELAGRAAYASYAFKNSRFPIVTSCEGCLVARLNTEEHFGFLRARAKKTWQNAGSGGSD